MESILAQAVTSGHLREIDRQAALFLVRRAEGKQSELLLAAALVSQAVGEGHICLPLEQVAGREVFGPEVPCRGPGLEDWREELLSSGLVGQDRDGYPLILDSANRLYFAKLYHAEQLIAKDLLRRSQGILPIDAREMSGCIVRLFPDSSTEDRQRLAVAMAAMKRFVVISGGPGTGKTYTVAMILALHQMLENGKLRVELVAPTGKAAIRMQESIGAARKTMGLELAEQVPTEAKTLHRLLGYNPGTGLYRYHEANKLHLDLLVIDEASMIDVELMAALLRALPAETKLIMLGDKNQLTSVEAGSLFGDICSRDKPRWSEKFCENIREVNGWAPSPGEEETFGDSIIFLKKSYRFQDDLGIAKLARLVNAGAKEQLSILSEVSFEGIEFCDPGEKDGQQWLEAKLLDGFEQCFACDGPGEALRALNKFRVLCSVRESSLGVTGINQLAETLLQHHGFINGVEQWYRGRPLIIRKNHYGLHLFNGDTGVVWPDREGKLWAWFDSGAEVLHQVPLSRLPGHDTAYAITVHQSQGSEFAEILFVLPSAESRVVSRELIYTGITRAREKLLLYADSNLLAKGVEQQVIRHSGLPEKLWRKN